METTSLGKEYQQKLTTLLIEIVPDKEPRSELEEFVLLTSGGICTAEGENIVGSTS